MRAKSLPGFRLASLCFALALGFAPPASADERRIEISFVPTARAQIAIWIESVDGARFATVRLTNAIAYRGIGNRPGALQMNSAFRWPYGRREGTLPIWAHRRADATGTTFPRVVFAGRESEGNASSAGSPAEIVNTRDDYFCLSFSGGDESLDAVSCASVFMSNKGRYLTDADVASGYAEPWQEPGTAAGRMRALERGSLYPPRQDLAECTNCADHRDTGRYRADARAVMPDLDAVSMATPPADAPFEAVFYMPEDWPDGEYVVFVEVNTEGDHAPSWDSTLYPTPQQPASTWDTWAINYGYPYRGQPSVLYRVPIALGAGVDWSALEPSGYGELHGLDGEVRQMDLSIVDDPGARPGSGADRLRADESGVRVSVTVPTVDVCDLPDPPEECGQECSEQRACSNPRLICGPMGTCVDQCDVPVPPAAPASLAVLEYPDFRRTHQWTRVNFKVPESVRGVRRYEARVGTAPIVDDASFLAARPAQAATIEDQALVIPAGGDAGETVEVDLGGLSAETRYWLAIRAHDSQCDDASPLAVAEFQTSAVRFTTVSPCFVATAAYGSPLDQRIGVLRRFRDRHLATNPIGRALISLYARIGPPAARFIARSETRRSWVRIVLDPIVSLAEWLDR